MSNEEYIWTLFTKRLAREATISQLQELDRLLKQYAIVNKRVRGVVKPLRGQVQDEIARRGVQLFENIKEKIRAKEDQSSGIRSHRPK